MSDFKDILEIVYFFSGPALVVIAYLALDQIKVAKSQVLEQKKAVEINSRRDALKLTSEQVSIYGEKIIPLQDILDKKIKDCDIRYFAESEVEINDDTIKVKPFKGDISEERRKLSEIGAEFTSVMNAMEGFSVFFVSGVADEKVAYHSLARTYCDKIKMLLPMLLPMAGDKRFAASIRLFHIWNSRLMAEDFDMQKSELERKIKSHKTYSVKTIGTA